ncbi:TolC family protein [Flammeovirga yaeyamensis]|uniref:TolC family protein n=1 Tax=Flammeovirga yaeyamensis TaxID=367791 RepID=A0AAX1N9V9_9BACT|nr:MULTISPECIES: TolC family protein [Flammeovirga]ANQ52085.2 TolC family protein [Flammeovirga sp. MY04]MBB3699248.1 outer membrane protein TolC [Flammeovirga yaeyamensis]NMF35489.1 TolC family protein [Flammeovirga yaeyamensis]QWG04348.1 TolC family protein [Flammeovirga yaeyamensis]
MIKTFAISIVLLSITHIFCQAQNRPIYQDTQIDSLTYIGLENNYLLKAKEMEVGIAKQNLASARKSWMSTFSFQVSTFRYSNTGTVTQVAAFNDLGVGLSIDLFTITSLNNRIRKAELEVVKNEMQYQNQLKIVKREYIQIYSAYLKATEQLKIFTEQEISQKELLQIVKDKLLRGEAKIEEYLLIEQRLHETRVAKIEAEVSAALAQHEIELLISE